MKFSHKVLLMPAFASASFLAALSVNELTGRTNSSLIERVKQGYVPALELSHFTRDSLLEIQRSMQDAVAADDVEGLRRADGLARELLARLPHGGDNPAFRSGELAGLQTAFSDYYTEARTTTERMIAAEHGEPLQRSIERMSSQYAGLRTSLEALIARQKLQMEAALEESQKNHRRSIRVMTAALLGGLLALGIVSRIVIRSTIGSLRAAVAAREGRVHGTSAAGTRAASGEQDEIDQLLSSMNDTISALADSERRLSEAQRLAHLGSWEWDASSSHSTWSRELQQMFGVDGPPPSDLKGYLRFVDAGDRARVKSVVLNAIEAGGAFGYEARIIRPDGEVRTLLTHGEVLKRGANLVRLRGVTVDITEGKRSEEALRDSELRYRQIFAASPLPTWIVERDTLRFLDVNDAAVHHYGYSREEFLGMSLKDVRPPEDVPTLMESWHRPQNRLETAARRHRMKNGTLIDVEITAQDTAFEGQRARIAMIQDVTERKCLEAQLRQAQKMEAIGRLAGGVAHDFNNILNVIIGYGDIVARRLPQQDPLVPKVREILKAADRAAGLTRQLLAFSRQQVLEPRALDLNAVVADVDKMLRRLIGEDVRLETRLEEALGTVTADAGQMEQVIMNIAVNARDAMPDGGTLVLETRNVELDAVSVRLHPGMRPGPYVMLTISDTGQGMCKETLSRIFEPFFTTKPQGQGTGLGLSMVYGIVQQSGGSISVDSEPSKGTAFSVYLPRIREKSAPAPAATIGKPGPRGTETILMVEDEPTMRSMIRELLEQAGYRVLEGATPRQALEIAEAARDRIRLMLTDVVMPEMSGPALAERFAKLCPEAAVVFMSGYTDHPMAKNGLLDPGIHYLQKPFSSDGLLWKVREALQSCVGLEVTA